MKARSSPKLGVEYGTLEERMKGFLYGKSGATIVSELSKDESIGQCVLTFENFNCSIKFWIENLLLGERKFFKIPKQMIIYGKIRF